MKRMVALILVAVLVMGMTSSALASTKYTSTLLKNMYTNSGYTASYMTSNSTMRTVSCVLAVLCYALTVPNGSEIIDELNWSGTAKVALWGSSVDFYFPRKAGGYRNLFLSPSTGEFTDYGYASSVSTSKTYSSVDMSEVLTGLSTVVSNLNN